MDSSSEDHPFKTWLSNCLTAVGTIAGLYTTVQVAFQHHFPDLFKALSGLITGDQSIKGYIFIVAATLIGLAACAPRLCKLPEAVDYTVKEFSKFYSFRLTILIFLIGAFFAHLCAGMFAVYSGFWLEGIAMMFIGLFPMTFVYFVVML